MEFFSAGFWTFATAITLALFGGVSYVVKRAHTLKDKKLERRDAEATEINERYIKKVEEAATLKVELEVERQAKKLLEEKCQKIEWELERMNHRGSG